MEILVKFSKDWADEFDVKGFKLFDSMDDWRAHYDGITSGEYYFGTNEGWDGSEFSEKDFLVEAIPLEAAAVIKEAFASEWGHFPS
jgi:hypothetical protein